MCKPRIFPGKIWNRPLSMEGKGWWKKEPECSRLVGGRLDKQGTYIWSLSWVVARRVDFCIQHPPRVYIETVTVFSHIYHPDSLTNTLLSNLSLAMTSHREVGTAHIPRTEEGFGSPDHPSPACGSIEGQAFLMTSSTLIH